MTNETLGGVRRFTTVEVNNLSVKGNETITGNLSVSGTLTAPSIIGSIAVAAGVVGTPDNGTTQTLTAGMVTGSTVFTSHTSTGGTTPSLTMPLATGIIAANSGWAIGDAYVLRIINLNSGTATVVTNTGITLTGTATIPTGGQADFIITMTGAATVSMVRVDAVSTVTVDAVQALTGKTVNGLTVTTSTGTLTIPNSVTLTGPASSGTAATLAGTETLTNKTLTGNINADTKRASASVTANGTTTYANVTGLSQTVVAGTYAFVCNLPSTVASGTGGIKYAFNYTTAVVSALEATGRGYTATGVAVQHTTTTTTQANLFSQAAVVIFTQITGTMVVGTGGTVDLQVAQDTSNASDTIALLGGSMTFTRIA